MRLWDLEGERELRTFQWRTGPVQGVAVSADGRRALSASRDGTVRLWDGESGRGLHRFEGHTADVHGAVFSPDGRHALSGSLDKTVRLWRLPEPLAADKP